MEAAQLNPEPSSTITAKHHVWETPGKKISIHLSFAAIDKLLIEVMRGFGAIPRRGAEVGGILLGHAEVGDRIVVHVEDFEPVLCEHKRGPSYLLSEADVARFAEALAKHRFSPDKTIYAVGCYRSHTREGLGLSPEDTGHFESYFPDISDVFLLIKPYATKVSLAGFFFREEDGRMRTDAPYLEFPFRRKELGGGATPGVKHRETSPVANVVSAAVSYPILPDPIRPAAIPEEVTATEPTSVPGFANIEEPTYRRRNVWIPLSFIFLLLGVLVGFQASIAFRPAKAAGLIGDTFALHLSAGPSGDYLLVRWDRTAPALKGAQRGVLKITEGGHDKEVDLDALQLQNPQVFYRNISDTVRFRLEVFTTQHNSVSETFDWRK